MNEIGREYRIEYRPTPTGVWPADGHWESMRNDEWGDPDRDKVVAECAEMDRSSAITSPGEWQHRVVTRIRTDWEPL